jgi:hypothetical protein
MITTKIPLLPLFFRGLLSPLHVFNGKFRQSAAQAVFQIDWETPNQKF